MVLLTQKPIETILKYLPDLAIKDLDIGLNNCDCENCEDDETCRQFKNSGLDCPCHTRDCETLYNEKLAAIEMITAETAWANGYTDNIIARPAETIYSWVKALSEYFGDITCTVYCKVDNTFYEVNKDDMDSAEDVIRELADKLMPF